MVLGPNCGVFDYDAILAANDICNKYGVDAITAGYTVGFVMALYAHKILSLEDTDYIKADFGNRPSELDLLGKMCLRDGFGDILAEGSRRASLAIGNKAVHYALQVKGMELTGYEPRAFLRHGFSICHFL